MGQKKYTITYEPADGGPVIKICKIWYGSDGSYYVTSPYHPSETALLVKTTVNYSRNISDVSLSDAMDVGSLDDDRRRLKLSHHPDGFVQFSGPGVVSGLTEDGMPRGIGVHSWPLDSPVRGPAFGISMRGVERFAAATNISDSECRFREEDLSLWPAGNLLVIEGYYFPAAYHRFIRVAENTWPTLSIAHPGGANLELKVLLPGGGAGALGFLGVEFYADKGLEQTPSPSFMMSTSTGNLRSNMQRELLGDGLFCFYPRQSLPARRSLTFTPADLEAEP